jgi:hypothetical protein
VAESPSSILSPLSTCERRQGRSKQMPTHYGLLKPSAGVSKAKVHAIPLASPPAPMGSARARRGYGLWTNQIGSSAPFNDFRTETVVPIRPNDPTFDQFLLICFLGFEDVAPFFSALATRSSCSISSKFRRAAILRSLFRRALRQNRRQR